MRGRGEACRPSLARIFLSFFHLFPPSLLPATPQRFTHPGPPPPHPSRPTPLRWAPRPSPPRRCGSGPSRASRALCWLRPELWGRVGVSSTAMGSLLQCLTTLTVKTFFLISKVKKSIHSRLELAVGRAGHCSSGTAQASISGETSPGHPQRFAGSPKAPGSRSPQPAPAHRANPAAPQGASRWFWARVFLIPCVFLKGK